MIRATLRSEPVDLSSWTENCLAPILRLAIRSLFTSLQRNSKRSGQEREWNCSKMKMLRSTETLMREIFFLFPLSVSVWARSESGLTRMCKEIVETENISRENAWLGISRLSRKTLKLLSPETKVGCANISDITKINVLRVETIRKVPVIVIQSSALEGRRHW